MQLKASFVSSSFLHSSDLRFFDILRDELRVAEEEMSPLYTKYIDIKIRLCTNVRQTEREQPFHGCVTQDANSKIAAAVSRCQPQVRSLAAGRHQQRVVYSGQRENPSATSKVNRPIVPWHSWVRSAPTTSGRPGSRRLAAS